MDAGRSFIWVGNGVSIIFPCDKFAALFFPLLGPHSNKAHAREDSNFPRNTDHLGFAWWHRSQNLMAPNLTAIAQEFGMSDKERDQKLGGEIAFAFFLVGAPAALAIGVATDRVTRFVLVPFLSKTRFNKGGGIYLT